MTEENNPQEPGLFDNQLEIQKEILAIETRKTRNMLLSAAATDLASSLLALVIVNYFTVEILVTILIVPALITGLAFLAMREAYISVIIAMLIFAAFWILTIVLTNGTAALSGWIAKALIIYFVIAAFGHAREVNRIKKEYRI